MLDKDKSIIDKIEEAREKAQSGELVAKENELEYKKAVCAMIASPEGRYFSKYFLKYLGVFTPCRSRDPVTKLEAEIRRNVYLEMIRPYMDNQLRMEIENL